MNPIVLEKLSISNFRNLNSDIIEFIPGINCIFGENGNGKTNLLEAIHVVVQKKSFRKNTTFPQFISLDSEEPEIIFQSLFASGEDDKISLSGKIYHQKNEFFLNGKPQKKKIETNCIFINPFDSFHFFSTPGFRRKWFDKHIALYDADYKKVLNKYNQALRFKNNLLAKRPSDVLIQLKAINKEIAKYSLKMNQHRISFLDLLEPKVCETFNQLFSQEHLIKFQLSTCFPELSEEKMFNALQIQNEKDLIIGHTRLGVHRDDFIAFFDGLNAFEVCSLGQQKMSFLSLVFAYIELFKYKFKAYPIVLIDDVSGELDRPRWKNLISYLETKNFQTFITTANEDFKDELEKIKGTNKLYVQEGKITRIN